LLNSAPSSYDIEMDVPLLLITPAAQAKVAAAARSAGHPDARLRVAIAGRRGAGFAYDLSLVPPDRVNPEDLVVETPQGVVYVAAADAERLRGATIGLDTTAVGGAITVDNPNAGWSDPLAVRVQDVLDREVNPGIAAHGGYIDLLEVRDSTAYISMGGGCVGCAQVDVTLRQGVDVAIKRAVPEIVAIIDTTDHASGTNPYYQTAKK
jgi:Fe/S biogenesis protein NfuA